MRTVNNVFSSFFQDNIAYKLSVIAFILLLIALFVTLLIRKLRHVNADENNLQDNNDTTVSAAEPIALKPAIYTHPTINTPEETPQAGAEFPADNMTIPLPPQPLEADHGHNHTETAINALLSSLTDIIFEFNEQKVVLNVWYNKLRNLKVDINSFKGKTVSENIGADRAVEFNKVIDTVISTRKSSTVEFLSFFGSGRWFSVKISPVFDDNGIYTKHISASVTDISEQKKYSAALRENEAQLIEAQRIAKIGNWWYDIEQKETHWAENLFTLMEADALPEGTSYFQFYTKLVHPEDRRKVYRFFSDLTANSLPEIEHRLITPRGNHKYFSIIRGKPMKDEEGKIIRINGIIKDVTESRQAERTIKKSQAELLEAQTIAKIGNWKWYFGRKTLLWSDEIYHIHEVAPTHQVQRSISHFRLLFRYIHPEDKSILLGFLKDPANRRMASYEYRIITATGKIKYLCIIVGKVRRNEDGSIRNVVGTLQDITAQKEAELTIQRTEDNYKLVLETIKLAAISVDKEGRIIFCNSHLAKLLDHPQDSLIGLNWHQHFVPRHIKDTLTEWCKEKNVPSNHISPVICRSGEQRIISWQNTTIYDEDGHIKQITSIGEDITDQQKDRQRLITEKEEAERSSLFKSEFLSTMSHEIRTPMNAVIGTTNLLLAEDPRPDQLTYLNNLKFSGENLLNIIDDILDYNKIEAGKLELVSAPVNLPQLIANIRQSFHARAMEKNLQLTAEIGASVPEVIKADSTRLAQILNNLVSNAIKFTGAGKVGIVINELWRSNNRTNLQFKVTDTGIGIEPANLERIFEPFVQETHLLDHSGSGLGLAIVKRLVALHQSNITVQSKPGEGTHFIFEAGFEYLTDLPTLLPGAATAKPTPSPAGNDTTWHEPLSANVTNAPDNYRQAPSPTSLPQQDNTMPVYFTPPSTNSRAVIQPRIGSNTGAPILDPALQIIQNADLSGMRVLVVDDNKLNILIANRFLNKWNITTDEASNGINAIEMIEANTYDLVIMDLQMPVMDGFEATKAIKRTHPHLPVIALTADAMPETYNKARNCGMDDYLTKPFMPDILYQMVSKYYKR